MVKLLSLFYPVEMMVYNISLEGFYNWFKQQAEIVLFIILIGLLIASIVKRAWMSMVVTLIGLSAVAIFIISPEAIKTLGTWLGSMLSIN